MKVGDILVCKRDLMDSDFRNVSNFREGKSYVIDYFNGNITILAETGRFIYIINNSYIDNCYIWDYFYTEKELRKLKLEEIGSR